MASNVVYDAIKTYLTGAWTTTPTQWENEPEVVKVDTTTGARIPWVMVEMTGTLYGQQSIGAADPVTDNRWDEEGDLWLHVFVPTGSGGQTARTYAKTLVDLFRGTQLASDHLEFMDATIGMGQPGDEEGLWFRISVKIEWRYIEA